MKPREFIPWIVGAVLIFVLYQYEENTGNDDSAPDSSPLTNTNSYTDALGTVVSDPVGSIESILGIGQN